MAGCRRLCGVSCVAEGEIENACALHVKARSITVARRQPVCNRRAQIKEPNGLLFGSLPGSERLDGIFHGYRA